MGLGLDGRWNTVVGTRDGVPVIHWPGVITCVTVALVLIFGSLAIGWAIGGPALRYFLIFMAGLNTGLVTIGILNRIRSDLQLPPDRLRCLDRRS